MKKIWSQYLVGLAALMASSVHAEPLRVYQYVDNGTYPVQTALGVVTQIEISPREQVKDFSSGLSNGWELVRRDNVFYVKPKDTGVDTNFIVRTAAHNYIFELKVVSSNWKSLDQVKDVGANYKVAFTYPEGTEFSAPDNSDSGFSINYDSNKKYHISYDVAAERGEDWLVPLRVYDDGKFTYVHMKSNEGLPTGTFPTVYGRKESSGEEFLVNTSVEGNVIVVHGVYSIMVLRHGDNVIGLRRN
ncbi:MAG: TrbG/VirB9 family P-type conjugative transfer protein [Formosimonas sp.]